jgi:hypothetical protein
MQHAASSICSWRRQMHDKLEQARRQTVGRIGLFTGILASLRI